MDDPMTPMQAALVFGRTRQLSQAELLAVFAFADVYGAHLRDIADAEPDAPEPEQPEGEKEPWYNELIDQHLPVAIMIAAGHNALVETESFRDDNPNTQVLVEVDDKQMVTRIRGVQAGEHR